MRKKENYDPGSVHCTFLIPAHLDKGSESISDLTAPTWCTLLRPMTW